jgi:hypothetical protein
LGARAEKTMIVLTVGMSSPDSMMVVQICVPRAAAASHWALRPFLQGARGHAQAPGKQRGPRAKGAGQTKMSAARFAKERSRCSRSAFSPCAVTTRASGAAPMTIACTASMSAIRGTTQYACAAYAS